MTTLRTRLPLLAALILILLAGVWALPGSASADTQVATSFTFDFKGRPITVVPSWYNPSDSSQDGSKANPFSPGSEIKLSLVASGFSGLDITRTTFYPNGPADLLGAALGMSTGAAHNINLDLNWSDFTQKIAPNAGRIQLSTPAGAGNQALWAFPDARFEFIHNGNYAFPISGSFYIGTPQNTNIGTAFVVATATEVAVTSQCESALTGATDQVDLNLTLSSHAGEDLHDVSVAWTIRRVRPTASGGRGVLLSNSPISFGTVKNGEIKPATTPAASYCLKLPWGSRSAGRIELGWGSVNGHAIVNGQNQARNPRGLHTLSDTFDITAPMPTEEELQELRAAVAAAREQVDQATKHHDDVTAKLEKQQTRATNLSERYTKAEHDYDRALVNRNKAAIDHQEAVAKANRLDDAALGKGAKAQARADAAGAVADKRFDRLTKREAGLLAATVARDEARVKADRALDKMKATLAEQEAAAKALQAAKTALQTAEDALP